MLQQLSNGVVDFIDAFIALYYTTQRILKVMYGCAWLNGDDFQFMCFGLLIKMTFTKSALLLCSNAITLGPLLQF